MAVFYFRRQMPGLAGVNFAGAAALLALLALARPVAAQNAPPAGGGITLGPRGTITISNGGQLILSNSSSLVAASAGSPDSLTALVEKDTPKPGDLSRTTFGTDELGAKIKKTVITHPDGSTTTITTTPTTVGPAVDTVTADAKGNVLSTTHQIELTPEVMAQAIPSGLQPQPVSLPANLNLNISPDPPPPPPPPLSAKSSPGVAPQSSVPAPTITSTVVTPGSGTAPPTATSASIGSGSGTQPAPLATPANSSGAIRVTNGTMTISGPGRIISAGSVTIDGGNLIISNGATLNVGGAGSVVIGGSGNVAPAPNPANAPATPPASDSK